MSHTRVEDVDHDNFVLRDVLRDLSRHAFPLVDCPPGVSKRASVALILRIKSRYPAQDAAEDLSVQSDETATRLRTLFDQPWALQGEPEVLFIKRASRKGDRWQGHVALPGGGRDPEDVDDKDTAIRETMEEVGIDLSRENSIHIGNLPQRIVTTSWGKVPLMVLCPYVFLLIKSENAQKLQPTEIASTHWVPLKILQTPALRTIEYQDVSNRLAKQEFGVKRWFLRAMLGQMMFSAIRLVPSESRYCTTAIGFTPDERDPKAHTPPLLLWGLTLGVVADFLDLLPPHNALSLWTYPTFSPPDVRFIIWAMSFRFRKRKQAEIQSGRLHSPAGVEVGLDAINPNNDAGDIPHQPEAGISGNSVGSRAWMRAAGQHGFNSSAIGTMLEGYYDIVRKGVAVALLSRCGIITSLAAVYWMMKRRNALSQGYL